MNKQKGKIGIFDSGLGGLVIAKAIYKKLPNYNYVYLGDTKNLPYGEKTPKTIYNLTKNAVKFLFDQNCELVILACNTASALALRKIQQEFLVKNFPERRVLGVIIPTLEEADKNYSGKKIAVIGTTATVTSHIYKKELKKIDPKAQIFEIATPKLVPLIEKNKFEVSKQILKKYLANYMNSHFESLLLGCTHYPLLKNQIRKVVGKNVKIISQDEIVPKKLAKYLLNHKNLEKNLAKNGQQKFFVTKSSENFKKITKRLLGKTIKFKVVSY